MPHTMKVAWVEKLKVLEPKKGSFAHSLLIIGKAATYIAGQIIDEVWCRKIRPDCRPGMKE